MLRCVMWPESWQPSLKHFNLFNANHSNSNHSIHLSLRPPRTGLTLSGICQSRESWSTASYRIDTFLASQVQQLLLWQLRFCSLVGSGLIGLHWYIKSLLIRFRNTMNQMHAIYWKFVVSTNYHQNSTLVSHQGKKPPWPHPCL